MKRRKKLGLKLSIKKVQDGPMVIERGKETPLVDDLFEIDDGVFVSGFSAAKQREKIENKKINVIFNISSYHCESPFNDFIEYHNYSLKDLPGEDIKSAIMEISQKVLTLNEQGKRILVHCYKVNYLLRTFF